MNKSAEVIKEILDWYDIDTTLDPRSLCIQLEVAGELLKRRECVLSNDTYDLHYDVLSDISLDTYPKMVRRCIPVDVSEEDILGGSRGSIVFIDHHIEFVGDVLVETTDHNIYSLSNLSEGWTPYGQVPGDIVIPEGKYAYFILAGEKVDYWGEEPGAYYGYPIDDTVRAAIIRQRMFKMMDWLNDNLEERGVRMVDSEREPFELYGYVKK